MARKKVGLALSGGGARGFAHVGVLKVLIENNIPIDMIAGTSAGAIAGACLASGMTIGEMLQLSARVRYSNIMLPALGLGGMFTNAPMGGFLSKYLPVENIEETKVPFTAVAFDLGRSEIVLITNGDLITAIRASCAVPGVFAPVLDSSGRSLVDGGVISPTPVNAVKQMGADIVIAVDLLTCGSTFRSDPRTGLGIMIQSAMTLLREAAKNEHRNADLVIEPAIAHLRPDQIKKRDEFISLGEKAARERLSEIKKLID